MKTDRQAHDPESSGRASPRSAADGAPAGFGFAELCRILGKDPLYVKNLQRLLELHLPAESEGYAESYVIFMEKVIALRSFHIPSEDIRDLFDSEKRVLRLLHLDSLSGSPTWYLDSCSSDDFEPAGDRLLLSGVRLGFPIDSPTVQPTLDFAARSPELFRGVDMGEDIRRVLAKYRTQLEAIGQRVEKEKPVLENALHWARRFIRRGPRGV